MCCACGGGSTGDTTPDPTPNPVPTPDPTPDPEPICMDTDNGATDVDGDGC